MKVIKIFNVLLINFFLLNVFSKLKFNDQGKFKVLQITDIHYGENIFLDALTTDKMRKYILSEKPDLVILTGDMVSGYAWNGQEQGWYKKQWERWTSVFKQLGQKYMYVQGNHDSQADLSRDEISDLDMTLEMSLTEKGPSDVNGTSNYVIPVYDQSGTNKRMYLWALDSMSDDCLGIQGWGCVYPNQIQWFLSKSKQLIAEDQDQVIPGYAFMHIPIPEYMNLWNSKNIYGFKNEEVCCFSVNTGLFSAFKQMNNIRGVFCGHDHNNDFYGDYYGISLYFGRKTGYGGYGPPQGMLRGTRVLEFTYNSTFDNQLVLDSWIRQEDNTVMRQDIITPVKGRQFQQVCCGMHSDEISFLKKLKSKNQKTFE